MTVPPMAIAAGRHAAAGEGGRASVGLDGLVDEVEGEDGALPLELRGAAGPEGAVGGVQLGVGRIRQPPRRRGRAHHSQAVHVDPELGGGRDVHHSLQPGHSRGVHLGFGGLRSPVVSEIEVPNI